MHHVSSALITLAQTLKPLEVALETEGNKCEVDFAQAPATSLVRARLLNICLEAN